MTRTLAIRLALVAVPAGVAVAILLVPRLTEPTSLNTRETPPGSVSGVAPTPGETQALVHRETPLPEGTYYVAVGGDDAGPGTRDQPWASLQHAADVARGEVIVGDGRYGGFRFTGSDLTFQAEPGKDVVVDGPIEVVGARHVALRGLVVQGATNPYEAAVLVERSQSIAIERLTVRDSTFGVHLNEVADVEIGQSEFTGNGSGIEIHGPADSVVVHDSDLHHNDRAVDASRGANGIAVYRAVGPIVIRDNRLWANYNPSPAPGTDAGGGAFELFASSDVRIEGNEVWDNSVLETGTEDGIACAGLVFVRNIAYRGPAATVQDGLVLRCAEDGLVAHNTIDGLDRFAFDVIHRAGPFAGSVEGLRIVNNIAVNGRAYGIDNELPPSVQIDYNLTWNPGSDAQLGEYLAYVAGRGNTTSFAELQTWGIDLHGIHADPFFVDREARDYRLRPQSPALGRGVVVDGLSEDGGSNPPGLGRWEP